MFFNKERVVKGNSQIKTEVRAITPTEAQKWLDRKHPNRKISHHTVSAYARDMAAGKWELNGDAIKFNGDGTLLDGQHRLSAIVAAGVPVRTLVITGVDSHLHDKGRLRTTSDEMVMAGEVNANMLSATVTGIYRYHTSPSLSASARPTYQEVLALLGAYPDIRNSVGLVASVGGVVAKKAVMSSVHFLASFHDTEQADRFVNDVSIGEGLTRRNPAFVLRERFIQDRLNKVFRLSPKAMFVMTTKAWLAYRDGRDVSIIRFKENEKIPRFGCPLDPEVDE